MTRIGVVMVIMTVIFLMVVMAISALAAHRLTVPRRIAIALEKNPKALGADFEEVRFEAHGDRILIAGWFIPAGKSRRAVVLVHGKDANRTREFSRDLTDDLSGEFPDLAVALSNRGFAVLMIDLRGHGESAPARFGFGRTERLDIRGALDWLESRGFEAGRIGVLGVSMGAAASIGAAADDGRIAAVVADSSFAELVPLIEAHWRTQTGLPGLLLHTTRWVGKHRFGCEIGAARPIDEIGKIWGPILLIHGAEDMITPIDHARRLKHAGGDLAELWEIPTRMHAGAYLVGREAYLDKVAEFLDRHLIHKPADAVRFVDGGGESISSIPLRP